MEAERGLFLPVLSFLHELSHLACDVLSFKLAGESLGNSFPSLLFTQPAPSPSSPLLFSVLIPLLASSISMSLLA